MPGAAIAGCGHHHMARRPRERNTTLTTGGFPGFHPPCQVGTYSALPRITIWPGQLGCLRARTSGKSRTPTGLGSSNRGAFPQNCTPPVPRPLGVQIGRWNRILQDGVSRAPILRSRKPREPSPFLLDCQAARTLSPPSRRGGFVLSEHASRDRASRYAATLGEPGLSAFVVDAWAPSIPTERWCRRARG